MWDGTDNFGKSVASGIYFYRARADQFSETTPTALTSAAISTSTVLSMKSLMRLC
jgi:hypothetical protein